MAPASKRRDTGAGKEEKRAPFTAVVYFHGMGSQRRYEETSRLIDSIDDHMSASKSRGDDIGYIYEIKAKLEPHSGDDDRAMTYIDTLYVEPGAKAHENDGHVRFYEVYWAPVMAGHGTLRGVVRWMFSQVPQPVKMLREKWRERQRLRRSALVELMETPSQWPDGTGKADFEALVRTYDLFEGPEARRRHETGSFEEFRTWLEKEEGGDPERLARLKALSDLWRRHYVTTEIRNAAVLATLALALLLAAGGTVAAILWLLQWFAGLEWAASSENAIVAWLRDRLKATWPTAAGLALSIVTLLGLSRFLVDYMGDVQAWATYEETDEKHKRRYEVITTGIDTLKHVLGHPQCERALLVSHSLGTTVAHDTLLALARENHAFNSPDPISGPTDMRKISHFVTIASPIDKISYFFESYSSAYHRYKRVVESLRGDIGDEPFCRTRKPFVHWVNFWDRADIISGPLHSPTNARSLANRVDNVAVSSLHFPEPGASHSAYFFNRSVIRPVFEMIYTNSYSFQTLRSINRKPKDYEGVYLGPGEAVDRTRFYFPLALAVPWLALLGLVFIAAGVPGFARWTFLAAVVAAGIVGIGWLTGKGRGATTPL